MYDDITLKRSVSDNIQTFPIDIEINPKNNQFLICLFSSNRI